MNKEEIDEIDKLEIDFNDIDELNLALEVSSKKAIYLIDELCKDMIKLQQENKQLKEDLKDWDRIFDTFSKRKYAHRYLEERRKEIPNLLCPDSDEIYKKYYELKDNWNKLKEWVFGEKMMFYNGGDGSRLIRYNELCNKMQELEKGDSNE